MTSSSLQLDGKIAVVTGAGRGIGKAIAIGYAQAGAAICCAARTEDEIEKTKQEIEALGGKAIALVTDVTDEDSVKSMCLETEKQLGGIDILVINAGGHSGSQRVEDSQSEDWKQILDVNLNGAFYCAHAVIPFLKKRGAGKIITLGSGLGHRGNPGSAAYSCSKAGLWMLTRILAQELKDDNISVNELIPGPVNTDLTPKVGPPNPTFAKEWRKQPVDVVPLALFLATQPDIGPTAQSFSLMRRDQ